MAVRRCREARVDDLLVVGQQERLEEPDQDTDTDSLGGGVISQADAR